MADFTREPLSKDMRVATERSYSLRERVNNGLDQVRALADSVLFEFGRSREQDLALRGRILRLQPRLRIIFVTRIALWKFRADVPGFELPEPVATALRDLDETLAGALDNVASRLDEKGSERAQDVEGAFGRLEEALENYRSQEQELGTARAGILLSLSQRIVTLTISLDAEISAASGNVSGQMLSR